MKRKIVSLVKHAKNNEVKKSFFRLVKELPKDRDIKSYTIIINDGDKLSFAYKGQVRDVLYGLESTIYDFKKQELE